MALECEKGIGVLDLASAQSVYMCVCVYGIWF